MAKQEGYLPISGTIGNLTFYKSQDGFMVKAKSSISSSKINSSANFKRTRENMAEFSRAGAAAGLLRTAFENILTKAKDSRLGSRLVTEMYKVIMADETNDRGERNVLDGELATLTGFDFNINAKLATTLTVPYTVTLDRASGNATINLPIFAPANLVKAPQGATHFQVFLGAAAIDFEGSTHELSTGTTAILPHDNVATQPIELKATVSANNTHPLFLALGVQFMEQVNGKFYPLNTGSFNPCSIIKVDIAS